MNNLSSLPYDSPLHVYNPFSHYFEWSMSITPVEYPFKWPYELPWNDSSDIYSGLTFELRFNLHFPLIGRVVKKWVAKNLILCVTTALVSIASCSTTNTGVHVSRCFYLGTTFDNIFYDGVNVKLGYLLHNCHSIVPRSMKNTDVNVSRIFKKKALHIFSSWYQEHTFPQSFQDSEE